MEKHASAIDKLLDKDNNDNIVLYNEKGVPTEFEQAALIPFAGKLYAILSLVNPNDDIGEDEGIVFSIEISEQGKKSLKIVTDDEIIGKVFDIYESLLDELEKELEDELGDEPDDGLDEILADILDDEEDDSDSSEN